MPSSLPACRSCGTHALEVFLDLGETPLANALLIAAQVTQPEPRYPLAVAICPACSLVQITTTVPPAELFSDYPYFSSYSETMLRHAATLARELIAERHLGANSKVLEIASNDGYLLQNYHQAGIPVLGIEPARNIAPVARAKGINTREAFFGLELARELLAEGHQADLIHAHNVLAHVPDLNGVIAGIQLLLKPGGVAVIEAPYLGDLLDHNEFDTIYHEHLCYFSMTAIARLVARHGLRVARVRRVPIHGGSLRWSLVRQESAEASDGSVAALLAEETAKGLDAPRAFKAFAAQVAQLRDELRQLLRHLKAGGATLAAYGASAKGSTLLNYLGVGRELLDFVADRSPIKQGRFTPGSHLPIVAPEELLRRQPSHVLLLTWNFADEIMAQQAEYRRRGGRFIVPVPHPRVV